MFYYMNYCSIVFFINLTITMFLYTSTFIFKNIYLKDRKDKSKDISFFRRSLKNFFFIFSMIITCSKVSAQQSQTNRVVLETILNKFIEKVTSKKNIETFPASIKTICIKIANLAKKYHPGTDEHLTLVGGLGKKKKKRSKKKFIKNQFSS